MPTKRVRISKVVLIDFLTYKITGIHNHKFEDNRNPAQQTLTLTEKSTDITANRDNENVL